MGERIRTERKRLHLSQKELALMVEDRLDGDTLDQSMISKYENGLAAPEPPKRRALEEVLEMPAGELHQILEPEAAARLTRSESESGSELAERVAQLGEEIAQSHRDLSERLDRIAEQMEALLRAQEEVEQAQ